MMDYFFLQALVRQLNPQLQGAMLNKVFQPQEHLIILRLWNGGRQQRLLIDLRAETLGLYITDQLYRNPMRPPRFCQLLRARLHRLSNIEIDQSDRVVRMDFIGTKGESYTLLVELFGRVGNVFLLDGENCVVDSLLRTSRTGQRVQTNGKKYIAPIPHGDITLAEVLDGACTDDVCADWVLKHLYPMSRAVATMLQQQVEDNSSQGLVAALKKFIISWQKSTLQPCVNHRVLTMQTGVEPLVINLSDFAQQHYLGLSENSGNSSELDKAVQKGIKKLRHRLVNIEQQIDTCLLADEQRKIGELLLTNLHVIRRGMHEVSVLDYYQDPPVAVVIPLDSAKLPQANAEFYFKQYRKGSRGLDHCERRQQQTNYEIDWLQQIEQQLSDSTAVADLDIIRRELIEAGWFVPQTTIQRETRQVSAASAAKHDKSPNGWEIIWGNNNKTNDYVTKNLLKPLDLWFHAHNVPGCHVILKNAGAEVEDVDLHYAATIAAQHSRASKDGRVDVMVTEGKWVQRIKGAPAGLVKVKQYRVITVKLN